MTRIVAPGLQDTSGKPQPKAFAVRQHKRNQQQHGIASQRQKTS
jgi:hypothetical protein